MTRVIKSIGHFISSFKFLLRAFIPSGFQSRSRNSRCFCIKSKSYKKIVKFSHRLPWDLNCWLHMVQKPKCKNGIWLTHIFQKSCQWKLTFSVALRMDWTEDCWACVNTKIEVLNVIWQSSHLQFSVYVILCNAYGNGVSVTVIITHYFWSAREDVFMAKMQL